MGIKTGYTENVPKNLLPGTQSARIVNVMLEAPPFDASSYYVIVQLEGPDKGLEFEGFLYDKDAPDGPRYKGQIGRVKSSRYTFKDGETKTGRPVYKDEQIARFISNLCFGLGESAKLWLNDVDGKFDTIEDLVEDFNKMLQTTGYTNEYFNFVVASKEYIKDGYTRHDLFFPGYEKGKVFIEKEGIVPSRLIVFNESLHIIKAEPKPAASFEAESGITNQVADDFGVDAGTTADLSADDDDLPF
jgi:hypothetical protein